MQHLNFNYTVDIPQAIFFNTIFTKRKQDKDRVAD